MLNETPATWLTPEPSLRQAGISSHHIFFAHHCIEQGAPGFLIIVFIATVSTAESCLSSTAGLRRVDPSRVAYQMMRASVARIANWASTAAGCETEQDQLYGYSGTYHAERNGLCTIVPRSRGYTAVRPAPRRRPNRRGNGLFVRAQAGDQTLPLDLRVADASSQCRSIGETACG
jgi:hypothetical protein